MRDDDIRNIMSGPDNSARPGAPAAATPRSRPQAGQGYGLPLVRGLARDSGTRLELSCAAGKGLTAALVFPADLVCPVRTDKQSSI